MSHDTLLGTLSYPVLLQYITQKICHDLATPIGALRLGLEHMEETDLTPLLMQSIDNATTRIDVFRTLFSMNPQTIDTSKTTKLLDAYLNSKNVKIETRGETFPSGARLMLGLGIVACEALPRGGVMSIDFYDLAMTCRGPIVHFPFSHFDLQMLSKENLQFKSGIILMHVLYIAESEKLTLEAQQEADMLCLEFKGKKIA